MVKVNKSHLEQILRDTTKPILVLDPREQDKYRPEALRDSVSYSIDSYCSALRSSRSDGWSLTDDDKSKLKELERVKSELDNSLKFEYARTIEEVYEKLDKSDYAFVLTGINAEELGVEASKGFDTRRNFVEELARREQPFVINTELSAVNALENMSKHHMCVTVDGPSNENYGLSFVLGSYAKGEALPVNQTQINYK
jgi:hypothetical protein